MIGEHYYSVHSGEKDDGGARLHETTGRQTAWWGQRDPKIGHAHACWATGS
jgi:hypothetical protein